MKKILLTTIALTLLVSTHVANAQYARSFISTSTNASSPIFPNFPWATAPIWADHFKATSTTATSTLPKLQVTDLNVSGEVDTSTIHANTSAGLTIHNSSHTPVALMGAGGGTGVTFYNGVINNGTHTSYGVVTAPYYSATSTTQTSTFPRISNNYFRGDSITLPYTVGAATGTIWTTLTSSLLGGAATTTLFHQYDSVGYVIYPGFPTNLGIGICAVTNSCSFSGYTGVRNTGFGALALSSLTSGTDNIGLGFNAFPAISTGVGNIGIGTNVGVNITNGSKNVFIGNEIDMGNNSSGVLIGSRAGAGLTGNNITAVGANTGFTFSDESATGSTYLGFRATSDVSVSSSTAIGAYATVNCSGCIVLGTAGDKIGMGTSSPYAKLSVVGEVVAPYYTATSTTATSTFNGDMKIGAVIAAPATPSGASATVVYGAGDYDNCGPYNYAYRVYSYKNVGASPIYSTGYSQSTPVSDDAGCDNSVSVDVSWSPVSGADGYRVLVYNEYVGYNYDYHVDTTSTSFSDGNGAVIVIGSTVTPTSFGPTMVVNSNLGKVGIATTSSSNTLTVDGTSKITGDTTINGVTSVLKDYGGYSGANALGNVLFGKADGTVKFRFDWNDSYGTSFDMRNAVGVSTFIGDFNYTNPSSPFGDDRVALFQVRTSPSTAGGGQFYLVTHSSAADNFNYNVSAYENGAVMLGSSGGNDFSATAPSSKVWNRGNVSIGANSQTVAAPTNGLYVQTKIGVATTTPNNIIDVYSTTKSAIGFSGASGSNYKWTMGMDVSNGGRFSIASSTALGTNDRFVIDGNGNVGIGTTTVPFSPLTVSSATAPQLSLSAGAGVNQWAFRNAGGNFYMASTTVAGTATTTPPALTIIGSTGNTGIGTSSPAGKLSVQGDSAGSSTKGTCFRAKDVGANTFTYWWYKAGVQTIQTTSCMGTGTTTVTYD